jgi:hypothetical protein
MYFKRIALAAVFLLMAPAFTSAQVGLNVDVESAVRAYFAETPVMIHIARCESKFRQYTDSGNPLYGGYAGKMVGVFQVFEEIHGTFARGKGMDIQTLNGNMQYAKYLYEREGTQPWISSFPCWGKEVSAETEANASGPITMNLSFGMENPQVLVLQKLLNEKGYQIAPDGPGSPGNETQKFGSLTRVAVKKFQCEKMQICSGDEYSNGYGFVGSKTRVALSGEPARAVPPPVQPSSSSSDDLSQYSEEEQSQIKALQAQILELTKVLSKLLGNS